MNKCLSISPNTQRSISTVKTATYVKFNAITRNIIQYSNFSQPNRRNFTNFTDCQMKKKKITWVTIYFCPKRGAAVFHGFRNNRNSSWGKTRSCFFGVNTVDNRGREPRLEVETFSLHWIPKTIVVATRSESQLVAFFASRSCGIQNNRTLPIENAKFFQSAAAWNVHCPVEKNETIASFDRKYRSNLSWGAISFEQYTYFVPQQKSLSFANLCSGISKDILNL